MTVCAINKQNLSTNTRITMVEVARKAGVSQPTVSRALRGDPRIPPATRARIQEVANKLGYRPDALLSAFASRRKGKIAGTDIATVAYVTGFASATDWRRHSFYGPCFDGAEECARQHGYRLEHFWIKEPGMTTRRLNKILYSRGIGALFIAPMARSGSHISLDWQRFASVTIGYSMLRPAIHRACHHYFHGLLMVLRALRRLSYRKIGLCIFAGSSKRSDDQYLAGMSVYQRYHPDMKLPVFLYTDRTFPQIEKWCKTQKLEVLICGDSILSDIRKGDIAIPKDLDCVSTIWSEQDPDTAGIDQRPKAVGAAAMDLVIAQLQRGERGIPAVPTCTLVEGLWVPGTSLRRL